MAISFENCHSLDCAEVFHEDGCKKERKKEKALLSGWLCGFLKKPNGKAVEANVLF